MDEVMEDSLQENGFDCKQDSDSSNLINQEDKDAHRDTKDKELNRNVLVRSKLWQLFPCSSQTRQWRYVSGIVAISSMGNFIWGYSFAVIGGAMLLIDDHFDLSVLWHETIVTMLVVGATVGAAIAGTLNDKFGRWKVMMTSAMLHIVAAVVMALAFSEVFLVVGRTIAGLALGMVILI